MALIALGLWVLFELARPLDRVRRSPRRGWSSPGSAPSRSRSWPTSSSSRCRPPTYALTIAAAVAVAVPAITIGIRAVGPAIGAWAGTEPSEG